MFKSLIFQPYIDQSNRIHSLKYQRFRTLCLKDLGIRKSEFVAKTQFLYTMSFTCFGFQLALHGLFLSQLL